MKKITVITPTYNRGYILQQCYESLVNQTSKDFTWMVIDDGSTDDTEEIIHKWIGENRIEITYLKKDNGGKASALNLAYDSLSTKYNVCLDSDDYLTSNAIENALNILEKDLDKNDNYCGLLALRTTPENKVLGGKQIPNTVKSVTLTKLRDLHKINVDTITFDKTNLVSNIRYPLVKGEKFISPAYVIHELNKHREYYVSKESFCVCEYLPDGLSANKVNVIKKNPKGYTIVKKQSFELSTNFLIKSKHALMYIAGSLLAKDKSFIKNSPHKLMTILYLPLGWLAYLLRFKFSSNKKK